MSLWNRSKDLTLAHLYKALEKAENPEVMIDQYVRNFEAKREEAQTGYVTQLTEANKLGDQVKAIQAEFDRLSEMVEAFAKVGKVESLKKAVAEKNSVEANLKSTKDLYQKNQDLAEQLHGKVEEIEQSIRNLKNERSTLIARYKTAEAEITVNKALSEFSTDSVAQGLGRMRDKVAEAEAKAEATNQVNTKEKSLEDEYNQLVNGQQVDDEVAELLKKYGHSE